MLVVAHRFAIAHALMLRLRPLPALAKLLLMALASTAWAAPIEDSELRTSSRPSVETSSAGALPARAAEAGKKETLDLLIEMQPKTPGLTFNERSRAERVSLPTPGNGARSEPAQSGEPAAAKAPVTASGLFGSGAVDPAATGRTDTRSASTENGSNWQPPAHAGAAAQGTARPGAGGQTSDAPPVFAFTRALVIYVRENREWFISGAVAALLLMWFASGGSGRRR